MGTGEGQSVDGGPGARCDVRGKVAELVTHGDGGWAAGGNAPLLPGITDGELIELNAGVVVKANCKMNIASVVDGNRTQGSVGSGCVCPPLINPDASRQTKSAPLFIGYV